MDKIEKALARLSEKERGIIATILHRLQANSLVGLSIVKLKGSEDIFRIRKGSIRIIYRKNKNGDLFLLAIERRNEQTYKDF